MTAQLDAFTRSYLETALWSSHDESDEAGGEPMDANYGIEDFAAEALAQAIEECREFQAAQADDLAEFERITERNGGHDFWLTRNGHGAGFWDRGAGPVGERLSEAAHACGERDLYIGDDGKVHCYG